MLERTCIGLSIDASVGLYYSIRECRIEVCIGARNTVKVCIFQALVSFSNTRITHTPPKTFPIPPASEAIRILVLDGFGHYLKWTLSQVHEANQVHKLRLTVARTLPPRGGNQSQQTICKKCVWKLRIPNSNCIRIQDLFRCLTTRAAA